MLQDIVNGGPFSEIIKRITDLEKFKRDHDTVFHAGSSTPAPTNILLNSSFEQFTRLATPSTPASMTDNAFNGPDGWYSLIQGSGATIARDAGIGSTRYSCKLTAGGTTNRYGIAQVRRASNSIPLRGQEVTFQIIIKPVNNAGSGSRDWRMAVLEWTGTADSVTTELVNDWTSSSYVTGAFFAATSKVLVGTASVTAAHNTETTLSVTGTVSASCNNILVFVWAEDVPTHASDYALLGEAGLYPAPTEQTWTIDEYETIRISEELVLLSTSAGGRAEATKQLDFTAQYARMRSAPSASVQGTIRFRDLTAQLYRTATTSPTISNNSLRNGTYIELAAATWSPGAFTINNLVALHCTEGNGILLYTGFA